MFVNYVFIQCSESDADLPSHTIHQVSAISIRSAEGSNMGSKNITMIRDLKLDRDDYMIKVRIIRLWKLTKFSNPNHVYEIDMVLMDEEGGKIQCNVEAAFIPRLRKLLEEYATIFIDRPTIGLNVGNLNNVDNEHRLYFYYTTKVTKCTDFIGSVHGFSFAPFHDLIGNTMPKDTTFDIIGDVVNLFKDNYTNPTVHKKLKINMEVQDTEGNKIFVTLWEDFAKQMLDYVSANPEKTSLVIILQFGRLNYYMGRPYVNNTYRSSKLFINENIDDIVMFKRNLLSKSDGQSSSSHRTISSSIVYSVENEFLSRNSFYPISAIHGLEEGVSAIVIGTIKVIEENQSWYYIACSRCRRKVQVVKATNDEQGEVVQKEESEVYWCSNPKPECQNNVVSTSPRFILRVRVQGLVGVVTLTLFDREVSEILNITAASLVEKYGENVNTSEYPAELTELIDRKLAFKLVVGKFNTVKNVRYYNVAKLTSDTGIISQLEIIEKKLTSEQETENETYNDTLTDHSSQETVNLKDHNSETGDNSTPISKHINNNYIYTSLPKMHTNNPNPVLNELKRKLVDVYDVDAPESESATKTYVKSESGSNAGVPIKLLIPKIEK